MTNHITPAVQAIIGIPTNWIEAPHPIEDSEVRRFYQGTLDDARKFRDERSRQYGQLIAPAGFILHMFRRPLDDDMDPLAIEGDGEFDGTVRRIRAELPPLPIRLPRVLNAGYDHEIYSFAYVGERIRRRSRYKDIRQRDGKTGMIVIVVIEDDYVTSDGRPLQKSTNTHVLR